MFNEIDPYLTAELHLCIHGDYFDFESLRLFLLQPQDRHCGATAFNESCKKELHWVKGEHWFSVKS